MVNLIRPAAAVADDWSESDMAIGQYMESVLGNLVAQLGHDNPADVILSAFFIGLILGKDPKTSDPVARAMWRVCEDAFGKGQTDAIRGATGGLVMQIRKVIRYGG